MLAINISNSLLTVLSFAAQLVCIVYNIQFFVIFYINLCAVPSIETDHRRYPFTYPNRYQKGLLTVQILLRLTFSAIEHHSGYYLHLPFYRLIYDVNI